MTCKFVEDSTLSNGNHHIIFKDSDGQRIEMKKKWLDKFWKDSWGKLIINGIVVFTILLYGYVIYSSPDIKNSLNEEFPGNAQLLIFLDQIEKLLNR